MCRIVAVLLACLAVIAGCTGPRSSQDLLREGREQLRAQDPEAAVISFRKAIERSPELTEARQELGKAYMLLGRSETAIEELQRALQQQPDSSPVRKDLARAHVLAGHPAEALRLIAPFVAETDAEGLETAAWARALRGDYGTALSLLGRIAHDHPQLNGTRVVRARILLMKGDAREAAAIARTVLEGEPGNLQALGVLGDASAAQGDAKAALAVYDILCRKVPMNREALYRKGLLLIENKRPREALGAAAVLVKKPLTAAGGYELRGRAYMAMRDYENAVIALQKSSGLKRSAELHRLQALCHLAENKPELALSQVQQALAIAPDSRELHLLAALVHLKRNRTEEALRETGFILAADGRNAPAHFLAASAELAQGRTKEAAASYRAVLEQDPDHVPALNNLAYVLAGERRTLAAALPYAARAAQLAPGDSAVQDTLGYVLIRTGRTDAGLQVLKQASSLTPDDPSICYHLALGLRDSRDQAGAITYLEKALSRGDFPERADAAALLAKLNAAR